MMTELGRFSVIVPAYNGAETMDECLTALVTQDYPQEDYEVIVVNDGSTDNTAEITSRYPVRLINLEANQGRVVARNTGATAARFHMLVFNDCRVIPGSELLRKVSQRGYQPFIPDVDDYDGSKWGFARFFYLLRSKIYAPYYPLSKGPEEFWVTLDNFDRVPKGATNFVCDRELWLKCQPEGADKDTNDDTRILRKIVGHRPILRSTAVRVTYRQRTQLGRTTVHMFERGPRFADYYLLPGGRYRSLYLMIGLLLGLIVLGVVLYPGLGIPVLGLLFLLSFGIGTLYVSQTPTDVIVVAMCFPIVVGAFGLGILRWQVTQWVNRLGSTASPP